MITYSQNDPRWKNVKLGSCSNTIGSAGCKITCLGMFAGMTPEAVNKIMPYVDGCLVEDTTAAKVLGLEFSGRTTSPHSEFGLCIAETDHYAKKGFPQHFFIYDSKTKLRIDPLDLNPVPEENNYNIVSYRLFKPLIVNETMDKDFVKVISDLCGENYGENINESEQKNAAKILKNIKDYIVKSVGFENSLTEEHKLRIADAIKYGATIEEIRNENIKLQSDVESLTSELKKSKEMAAGGIIEMTFIDLLRELKNRIIRF
jgi:hypothetical protein